jgi:hypothetical protein
MLIHPSNRRGHGCGAPKEPCTGGETYRGGHKRRREYRTRDAQQASRAQELVPKLCAGAIGDTRKIETDPNGRRPVRSTIHDLACRRIYRLQTQPRLDRRLAKMAEPHGVSSVELTGTTKEIGRFGFAEPTLVIRVATSHADGISGGLEAAECPRSEAGPLP